MCKTVILKDILETAHEYDKNFNYDSDIEGNTALDKYDRNIRDFFLIVKHRNKEDSGKS